MEPHLKFHIQQEDLPGLIIFGGLKPMKSRGNMGSLSGEFARQLEPNAEHLGTLALVKM